MVRWRLSRRTLRLVVTVAVATAVLPVAAVAGCSVEAGFETDLRQGKDSLSQGIAGLEAGYARHDAAVVERAAASFAASRRSFGRVAAVTRQLAPAAGGFAPGFVRGRISSLAAAAAMAIHVDEAGIAAARAIVAGGIVGPPARAAPPDRLVALLQPVRTELKAARRAATGIDLGVLPAADRPALARAIAGLDLVNTGLDQVWPSLTGLMDLLGFQGPRMYLVEQVNPAELRSGGGFIGTISLLRAEAGRVDLDRSVPVESFDLCDAAACVHPRPLPWQPGYVAPPRELAGPPLPPWSQLTSWSLEDSGFYPDFASNAVTAEEFGERQLGVHLDGVIAVDYYAVAPLLDLTRPIELPDFHLTLTRANFVDTIVGLDLARDPSHKDVISRAAAQLVGRLSRLRAGSVTGLLEVLRTGLLTRHVQAHFDNPAAQESANRLGVTDALNPRGASDFLLETEDNYGGSKANHFMARRYELALSHVGPTLVHRLTVDLVDRAPADRPWIGPHYTAYVRLYVPDSAQDLALSSAPSEEYAPVVRPARRSQVPPPGSAVAGGWIFIQVGDGLSGHYQLSFEYSTPWQAGPDGSHRLYWQKQPGQVSDPVLVTFRDESGEWTAGSDLSADRVIELGPVGVRIAGAA